MTLDITGRYPVLQELRDGTSVTLRPMSRADESALVDFFREIAPEERYFLKDDVTSPSVIREWITEIDYDNAFPLLAIAGHRIVGDAALLRNHSRSMQRTAEIRAVTAPDYRDRGLAVAMMTELIAVAQKTGLEEVVFEFVRDVQDPAVEAAEFLGAKIAGTLPGWVRDPENKPHDVVFLRLDLKPD